MNHDVFRKHYAVLNKQLFLNTHTHFCKQLKHYVDRNFDDTY